jgi:chromosome partitioning protein
MDSKIKKESARVVSVLNMKGGVGKTTISAHLFRHMLNFSKSVLLIDFDPQFNLTQALMTQREYKKFRDEDKTIFSVMEPPSASSLFSVTKNMGPPPLAVDIEKQLRWWVRDKTTALGLVTGDFRMTKYTLVDNPKILLPAQKRFLEFIEQAKEHYDLICIDCNPSSSFMTLCALTASTHLLIPVRPDRYSMLGLEMLDEFVAGVPSIVSKPKQIVLINSGPGNSIDPGFESTLRANSKFGPVTLPTAFRFSSLLGAKEGKVGSATDKKAPYVNTLKANFDQIITELKGPLGWH